MFTRKVQIKPMYNYDGTPIWGFYAFGHVLHVKRYVDFSFLWDWTNSIDARNFANMVYMYALIIFYLSCIVYAIKSF